MRASICFLLLVSGIGLFYSCQTKSHAPLAPSEKLVNWQDSFGFDYVNPDTFWSSHSTENYDTLEEIYHQGKSFTKGDTLYVTSKKHHRTIKQSGIFRKLKYDYLLTTPWDLTEAIRIARLFEEHRDTIEAMECYREAVDFSKLHLPNRLRGFSDLDDYRETANNSYMLISYAYEKLGKNNEAISTLMPLLYEGTDEYQKLLVRLYLKTHTKQELRKELDFSHAKINCKQYTPSHKECTVNILGREEYFGSTDSIGIRKLLNEFSKRLTTYAK